MVEIFTFENQTSIVITDAKGEELGLIAKAKELQSTGNNTNEDDTTDTSKRNTMPTSVFAKFKCNQKANTEHKDEPKNTHPQDNNQKINEPKTFGKPPIDYDESSNAKDILNGDYPTQRRNNK